MKNVTKWMLAAAMTVGGLGLTAAPAKAAQIGVYVGTGAEYVPPCPGPGYVWTAGYFSNGVWIPGRWIFNGVVVNQGYHGNQFFGDRDDHGSFTRDRDNRDAGRNFDNRDNRDNRGGSDNNNRGRNNDQGGNRGRGR
jgi:hypothetical protein